MPRHQVPRHVVTGAATAGVTALIRRHWRAKFRSSRPLQFHGTVCPRGHLRVLYLTHDTGMEDYLADTLAHGFVTLLGPNAVAQHPRREVLYTTPALLFESRRAPIRTGHYGAGFSYANGLFDLTDAAGTAHAAFGNSSPENDIRVSIAGHEFDVIVFSLIHRGPPPLMDAVCSSYLPARIAAVHGNDPPPSAAEVDAYASCAGFYFAREAMTVEG